MELPLNSDPLKELIAKGDLEQAQGRAKKRADDLNEIQGEIRSRLDDYFKNIAFISGGSIPLSLTLVSVFRQSGTGSVPFVLFLIVAWVFLFITLITATYVAKFHSAMFHFAYMARYCEGLRDERTKTLELVKNGAVELANVRVGEMTQEEFIKAKDKDIQNIIEGYRFNKKHERWNELGWLFCRRCAEIGLILGLLSMLVFAVRNLWALK